MPPLPSSLGMRESRLCWGSVSVSSVIAGWQASFDSESGIYEMKTNLRELTTVSFLASPARLPFFHLSKSYVCFTDNGQSFQLSFTFNDFNASVLRSIHSFGGKTEDGVST